MDTDDRGSVHINKSLMERVRKIAGEEGRKIQAQVERWLSEAIEQYDANMKQQRERK